MFKSTKCTRSFQRKHVLQFGLEIVELEEKGNMPIVTGVCCMFCVYHGWDVKLTSCKCMLIDNIHISKAPFIKQHYLLHLKQHAETWEEYNELSIDDKKVYFDGKVKRANTMHMYIALTRRPSALLSLLIVDVIIKELFYPDDNQILVGIDEVDDEDEEDHHMNMEDGSTHRSNSFFIIHICINDVLSNLHLVVIQMFEQHTAKNIFNLIAHFLDALRSATTIWHAKFMSMSTEGENRMIGCHHGVVTRFEQTVKFPVLRIWCVPHHIDIVIKNAVALPQDG
ncbi:unnamed protein product [Sphagnum jensenii]|uniref:Transposase n=1 Tax=Sphagnum jensenii TaxID=128206 RepID=A0ABP1BU25_9BRYO